MASAGDLGVSAARVESQQPPVAEAGGAELLGRLVGPGVQAGVAETLGREALLVLLVHRVPGHHGDHSTSARGDSPVVAPLDDAAEGVGNIAGRVGHAEHPQSGQHLLALVSTR